MDQAKIGRFLADLRKEKSLTQEQLAEKIGVARRTISRWETGNNLPDLDLLIMLSDLYEVDLREILDGARQGEAVDSEVKETLIKVAEYNNAQTEQYTKMTLTYMFIGLAGMIVHIIMDVIELPSTALVGFIGGISFGLGLGSLTLGILYITGLVTKVCDFKKRVFHLNK